MLETLSAFIVDYGYLHLFVLSFLASTVLPFGSEALVIALIYKGFGPLTVVMVATTGNFFGACTTYYLGLKGRHVLERYLSPSPEKLEKSERLFSKYGIYTLLFTWVPGIGDVITMVAGLMQLPFRSFSILVFLGKFARYLVLAYSVVFFNGRF
ncbi:MULTISPECIES: YqaA family protein [unclassified Methanosarcina]|uniref:YqaA family protein n=1 Tax=unclassified Methanosarcina TaxID=2644672 RepID=UPI000615C029|nr:MULTISPECIES: YqaA family protein [unclassified Methanosarcina]AKB17542.1 SNARE associated Golgi protein [Methanosarcina sp. WWM596]AKB20931.1 SNARE associated Golgi protein [Methanosarcina sp. WH1]